MTETIAELVHVTKQYDQLTAVRELDLKINRFEFTALLGPSGCGKSTTLRILAGFESVDSGAVFLNGENKTSHLLCPPEKRNVGMVFQDLALFPHLNVIDNISFGLKGKRKENKERARELLQLVGLSGMDKKMPYALSGGQQQRVAVARALAPRPTLILMDEPFSSLDYQLRLQMRKELREILKQEGVTVVLVTHDCQEAFSFADRIVLMNQGQIVQVGSPVEIYHQPQTPWAAEFMGGANFITAEAEQNTIQSELGCFKNINGCQTGTCYQMIRPENLSVFKTKPENSDGRILHINFLGDREVLTIKLNSGSFLQAYVDSGQHWSKADSVSVHARDFHLFPQQALAT